MAAAVLICWLAARRLWKSLLATGLAAAALVVLWWGSWQLFASHQQVVAVAGIGTVVLLGLAPRLALATSGMNRLDDDVAQGDRPSVPHAEAAFIRAHAGLAAAVILCAVSVTLAVHGLLDGGFTRWTLPLAILLVVLTALRARSMPLAIERAALLASAAASSLFILLALTDHLPSWLLLTIPVVLALLPVLLSDHSFRSSPSSIAYLCAAPRGAGHFGIATAAYRALRNILPTDKHVSGLISHGRVHELQHPIGSSHSNACWRSARCPETD